jgi:hypothetical protein
LEDGKWHQIAGTYSQNSRIMKSYVDGKVFDTRLNIYVAPSKDGVLTLSNSEKTGRFAGDMDNVRIYNFALHDSDIQEIYDSEKALFIEVKIIHNCKQGDINGDGLVNNGDIALYRQNFRPSGKCTTSNSCCNRADVNGDGKADSVDMAIIQKNYDAVGIGICNMAALNCPASGTCADDCTAGDRRCYGRSIQICGNYDSDTCKEWGASLQCSQACLNGACTSCASECSIGKTRCSGNYLETCGNYQSNSCSQWGGRVLCAEGCNNGACIVTNTGTIDRCSELSTTERAKISLYKNTASLKGKSLILVEGDGAKIGDFIALYSKYSGYKIKIVEVVSLPVGTSTDDYVGLKDTDSIESKIIRAPTGVSDCTTTGFVISGDTYYLSIDKSLQSKLWNVQVTWGVNARCNEVGIEKTEFLKCVGVN